MEQEVKKTPAALKWLAEKRARLASEVVEAEGRESAAVAEATSLRADLAAIDRSMAVHSPGIDVLGIEAVHAWAGNYGRRGALTLSLARILQSERDQEWVSAPAIASAVIKEFELVFDYPEERGRWYDNSFRSCLRRLVIDGHVEQRSYDQQGGQRRSYWRWKREPVQTLANLRAMVSPQPLQ